MSLWKLLVAIHVLVIIKEIKIGKLPDVFMETEIRLKVTNDDSNNKTSSDKSKTAFSERPYSQSALLSATKQPCLSFSIVNFCPQTLLKLKEALPVTSTVLFIA